MFCKSTRLLSLSLTFGVEFNLTYCLFFDIHIIPIPISHHITHFFQYFRFF